MRPPLWLGVVACLCTCRSAAAEKQKLSTGTLHNCQPLRRVLVYSVDFTPDPPEEGNPVDVVIHGVTPTAITPGDLRVVASFDGVPLVSKLFDTCDLHVSGSRSSPFELDRAIADARPTDHSRPTHSSAGFDDEMYDEPKAGGRRLTDAAADVAAKAAPAAAPRCQLGPGSFWLKGSFALPELMFRGDYILNISMTGVEEGQAAPSEQLCAVAEQMVIYGSQDVGVTDYMHAIICFMVGGASSYYLAQFFPFITKGTLPLITGYLAMGVVVGPYVTNMVTTYHIFLLSSVINKFALSFIAAAAGSEIFFPELRGVIWPIICQLFFIFVMNFAVLVPGIHYLTPYLHFISAEPKECQLAIIFLIATIMLARSPASAVALIQEAKATGPSAKVMLGITVMSDLVVLIAFAIVTAGVRVVCAEPGKQAKHIDWLGVTWILSEIGASVAIGLCLGLILLFILWVPIRRYAVQTQYFTIQIYRSQVKALFILPICFSAFIVSDHFYRFSSRHMARGLKLEPLIVLIVAACLAGHDRRNRHKFANILDKAAPAVFLPFFVLTGASLQLEALHYVMGVALAISGLRILGILLGSSLGGCFQISCSMNTDYSEVKYMWTTLIAQAGVALGLALEVQSSFPSWGRPFTTLILAIVVISQIIGPVACKFGLYQMQQAEVFQQQHEWRQSRPIAGIKTVGQEPDLDIYRMGSSAVLRSLSTRMSQFVNREPAPGDNQPRDASFSPVPTDAEDAAEDPDPGETKRTPRAQPAQTRLRRQGRKGSQQMQPAAAARGRQTSLDLWHRSEAPGENVESGDDDEDDTV